MKIHHTPIRLIIAFLTVLGLVITVQPRPAQALATSWQFPLGGDGNIYATITGEKYGSTVVNTNFDVRNLELISTLTDHITCFGMGWHSIYHAGVDFYRQGASTEGAPVHAVADGTVVYASQHELFPGDAVIIRHDLPGGGNVYSVYEHLNVPSVISGTTVVKGQQIATVYPQTYSGRYPEFYTNNDNAHLHFEIRPFFDARALFPQCSRALEVGPGYVYPASTISNWYDPIAYIAVRIATNNKAYLPLSLNSPAPSACIDGQDMIGNTDFEDGSHWAPNPWIPVATTYTGPQSPPYLINDAPVWGGYILSGTVAELGALSYNRITDEELTQSFTVPPGTTALTSTWLTYLQSTDQSASAVHWRYHPTYFDASTGEDLVDEANNGCAHDNTWIKRNTFLSMTCSMQLLPGWDGRKVRVAFVALGDGVDGATLYIDHMQVRTGCGTTQAGGNAPVQQMSQTESSEALP